jgi:hypothetical protein
MRIGGSIVLGRSAGNSTCAALARLPTAYRRRNIRCHGGGERETSTTAAAAAAGPTPAPSGLDSVPLDFEFRGSFFDLADFFHRMKRFVRVANDQLVVRGRLLTIDSFSFARPDAKATGLKAEVTATIYLTPPDQGTTAGATPAGPAAASPSDASSTPPSSTSSTPTPTPTATATP